MLAVPEVSRMRMRVRVQQGISEISASRGTPPFVRSHTPADLALSNGRWDRAALLPRQVIHGPHQPAVTSSGRSSPDHMSNPEYRSFPLDL